MLSQITLNRILTKIKSALKNENCTHCQSAMASEELICSTCRTQLGMRDNFPLSKRGACLIYSATLFNSKVKRLLYPYKFYHRTDYTERLSNVLIDYWKQVDLSAVLPDKTLVVPIPSRWKENHVSAFAQHFAHTFNYTFDETLLEWGRDTVPQHKLTGKRRRWENVSGSMQVDLNLTSDASSLIHSKEQTILIIDDMTTTGATFHEASQAFQRIPGFQGQVINFSLCHVPLALRRQII